VTLINHYVKKYDEPYLKKQVYLNPTRWSCSSATMHNHETPFPFRKRP